MKPVFSFLLISICFVITSLAPRQGVAQTKAKKDTCLSGDCKNGAGILLYSNSNRYDGTFKDGLPDGKGKMEYATGAVYDGDWLKGNKNGKGNYRFRSGNRYEGDYVNNRIEGTGVFYYLNSDRYEGQFVNGDFQGQGTYHYASGNKYVGAFVKNKKDGNGVFTFPAGSKYIGQFRFDEYEGKGVYYFKDGSRYEGDFVQGNKHGKGAYIFKDSSRYEGEFYGDAMQGKGLIKYSNGDSYEGDFVNGMSDGRGAYYYANGDKYEGNFRKNDFDGVGTFTTADGVSNTVTYRNGVMVPETLALTKPLEVVDSLVIESEPTEQKVDSPNSVIPKTTPELQPENVHALNTTDNNTKDIQNDSTGLVERHLADGSVIPTTIIDSVSVVSTTTAKPSQTDSGLLAMNTETSPIDSTTPEATPVTTTKENKTTATATTKPTRVRCTECAGSGKRVYKEETRKRVVTKDISNGVGPKNYVTYTVTDVVRPGGQLACRTCRGSGFATP